MREREGGRGVSLDPEGQCGARGVWPGGALNQRVDVDHVHVLCKEAYQRNERELLGVAEAGVRVCACACACARPGQPKRDLVSCKVRSRGHGGGRGRGPSTRLRT